jgi:hypothetical protein
MTEEDNEAVAYLRALKRAADSPAANLVAPTMDSSLGGHAPGTVDGNSGRGSERRRSPRYKCEGSVDLREKGCNVWTFASFTDISLGGCYVEAQATYPVGTSLHMKLQANGFRVETGAEVRVNYPYLGMGIAFTEMSEESRARLRDLLCSISPTCGIMGPGITSALPTVCPLSEEVPPIVNPDAAVRALIKFFTNHEMLIREDFLKVLHASQIARAK